MIDGTFDISVDTPKLHRRGTISLKSEGDTVAAVLNVGEDLRDEHFEGTCSGKEFTFEGAGDYPGVGQIDYKAKGSIWGNSLDLDVESSAGKITIFGTRIGGAAGANVSSHDSMMRASRADFSYDDGAMYSGLFSDNF